MLSHFCHVPLFVTSWTVARQAPLSMGISKQEYWSGLPCPPPGDLINPGIELASLASPALADFSSNHVQIVYWCESWTRKKNERWRIDAFKLWYWRRLLKVPWTARRLNQAILKEINSEFSLEGLILKRKLQYFGHLMRRADSLTQFASRLNKQGDNIQLWRAPSSCCSTPTSLSHV